jgi:glycosyltransferase involved in cell wall biosynthesis
MMKSSQQKLRVLFVAPYFAPAWGYGGPPRFMFDVARGLVQRGHGVTVLTTDALDETSRVGSRYDEIEGIRVHYFPNLSNWLCWNQKIFLPLGFRRAVRQHVAASDIVHLSDFRTLQNAITYRVALRHGVPYLLSAFGQLPRAGRIKGPLKYLYDLLYGREMLHRASAVLAQTANEIEAYRRFGIDDSRILLLPLAIDTAEFDPLPPRGKFRARYGIGQEALLFLFLGRIHRYKGLDLLLQGFAALAQEHDTAHLAIVGRDDGHAAEVQRQIERLGLRPRVTMTGPIYGPERIAAYHDADVFTITPVYAEETSLAALEACAAGTPVIVTRQASIPWLEDYRAGFAINADAEELAGALREILGRDEMRADMGRRAKQMIEEQFSLAKIVARVEEAYLAILAATYKDIAVQVSKR